MSVGLAGWLQIAVWAWVWSHISFPLPQTSGLARTEMQEPIPTVHGTCQVFACIMSVIVPLAKTSHVAQSQGCMEVEGGKGECF